MRKHHKMKKTTPWVLALTFALFTWETASATDPEPSHGYSVFEDLQNPPGFTNYSYVNPDAPKGGDLKIGIVGTFDSLQDLSVKGTAAQGLTFTYDTLMSFALDELGAQYGLIAESITVAPDYSWVSYDIRPEARWHDGNPVVPEDVIFSLEAIQSGTIPVWSNFLAEVEKAEKTGPRTVKFTFTGKNHHKLIYNVGGLRVLPKHYWDGKDFNASTTQIPIGSGPYRVTNVEQGRTVTYTRDPNYWARDLPVRKGQNNFDTITYDYYLDPNSEFEAFKTGDIDFRVELNAQRWAKLYNFNAMETGDVVKKSFRVETPSYILTYATNMRHERFEDVRVRKALENAFTFNWLNDNFFHGLYQRIDSYFDNSSLSATGLPDAAELKLLEPFRDQVPAEVFTKTYVPHDSDPKSRNREGLKEAKELLEQAGWFVIDGKLTHQETSEVFTLELLVNNTLMQRVSMPYIAALKRLGIQAETRLVDNSQYFNRLTDFDYDMIVVWLPVAQLPTRGLRDYWGSAAAGRKGSLNFAGIKDPVVDHMLEIIANSNDREEYFAAIKAVDRVMLWNHYMLPMYTTPESWRAYRKELKHKPWEKPMFDYAFPAIWWYQED